KSTQTDTNLNNWEARFFRSADSCQPQTNQDLKERPN
ncbi:MAG: hypothetical protein ACI87E_002221, partial [Mariniblastus sp.]